MPPEGIPDVFGDSDDLESVVLGVIYGISKDSQITCSDENNSFRCVKNLAGMDGDIRPFHFIAIRSFLNLLQVFRQDLGHRFRL